MFDSVTEAVDPALLRAQHRVGQTLLGKWHLDVLLGVGGMAAVYAATHRNESRAAIKILHPELTLNAEVRRRFLREGRAANRIAHPGVVKVIDEDQTAEGEVFLIMELLDGESLEARAARYGREFPVDEVLSIADHVLDVLAVAHEKGVLHRDLKPENIFLTREGQLKVLDFGIARLRELSGASHATRTGTSMGTPAYMAPEQARGLWDEVDARSDLWALGATMFSLLAAQPVHDGRTVNEVLVAACTSEARSLASVATRVPKPVSAVVDRALAFSRDSRWSDARAMQDAVRRAYEEIHTSPISSAPKLTVPPSVRDKTLPSADLSVAVSAGVTEQPVVNGLTGKSLLNTITSHPRVAFASAGAVGVVVVISVAAIGFGGGEESEPATSASAAQPSSATTEAPSNATPTGNEPKADASTADDDPVSVDDLPPVEAEPKPAVKRPAPPPPPAPVPARPNPYLSRKPAAPTSKPPTRPAPGPSPKPASGLPDERKW